MQHGESGQAASLDLDTVSAGLSDADHEKRQNLFRILTDTKWRKACFAQVDHKFPAIVTYLSQLLAHDVTRTARFDSRFENSNGGLQSGQTNLRSSGLLLHTIYGEGMHLDGQLYRSSRNSDRRPSPSFRLIRQVYGGVTSILPAFSLPLDGMVPARNLFPLLGDMRNADTPMLLWIAVEFMKYHNRLIQEDPQKNTNQKFRDARIKAILTWHNIIEHEVLPHLTGETTARDLILDNEEMGENDLFHGLMRAFHVLPLNSYKLISSIGSADGDDRFHTPLNALTHQKAVIPSIQSTENWDEAFEKTIRHWHKTWRVELDLLTDPSGANLTCFSPSFAVDIGAKNLLKRDFKAAVDFDVSPMSKHAKLQAQTTKLLEKITQDTGEINLPDAKDLPLSIGFLAEAFCKEQKKGTLGEIGGALFATEILARIDTAQAALAQIISQDDINDLKASLPNSFATLMNPTPQ